MYEIKSKSESSCCQDFTIEMKFETSSFGLESIFFLLNNSFQTTNTMAEIALLCLTRSYQYAANTFTFYLGFLEF